MFIRYSALILFLVLSSSHTLALQLGNVESLSTINQPIKAKIAIAHAGSLSDINSIRVQLANDVDYRLAGIERLAIHKDLEFKIIPSGQDDGRAALSITSYATQQDPYSNFLIEVRWSQGKLVKEITILYDIEAPSFLSAPNPVTVSTSATKAVEDQISRIGVAISKDSGRKETKKAVVRASKDREVYRIKKGDTLWSITTRLSKTLGVTNQQFLVVIKKLNPSLVTNGLRLKIDDNLYIPAIEDFNDVDLQVAYHEAKQLLTNQPSVTTEVEQEIEVSVSEDTQEDGIIDIDEDISSDSADNWQHQAQLKKEIEAIRLQKIARIKEGEARTGTGAETNVRRVIKRKKGLPKFYWADPFGYDYIRAIKYFWDNPSRLGIYPYVLLALILMGMLLFWDRKRQKLRRLREEETVTMNKDQPTAELQQGNEDIAVAEHDLDTTNNDLPSKDPAESKIKDMPQEEPSVDLSAYFDKDDNAAQDSEVTPKEEVVSSKADTTAVVDTGEMPNTENDIEAIFSEDDDENDTASRFQFALKCIEMNNNEEALKTLEELKQKNPDSDEVIQLSKILAEKAKEENDKPLF